VKARLLRHFKANDPVLARIVAISDQYGLDGESPHASAFEVLARSIASQQLSGLVARKIIERLIALHGGAFPTPAQLAAASPASLRAVGFSYAKIAALHDLAAHALDGRLPPDEQLRVLEDEAIIERCIAVRGVGRWTVQMLLMFHFGRPDVMPVDDYGVRNGFRLAYGLKGLPRPRALLAYSERWRPYRSAGAWYLWRAVELHQQGNLPRRSGRAPRVEIVVPSTPTGKARSKLKKVKRVLSKAARALRRPRPDARRAAAQPRRATPASRRARAAPRRP
jgi:DNA-3-methyladenine glycosylase II